MRKFRKKGDMYILAIVTLLFIGIIAMLFMKLMMSSEMHTRVKKAAEVGVETRALAVNIPLKEELGIIETFRDPVPNYEVNYAEPNYSPTANYGYDQPLLNPASEQYKRAKAEADASAKEDIIREIEYSIGTNESGEREVVVKPENICFQVKPLPVNDSSNKMDFECSVTTPHGETVKVKAKNVTVYGVNHQLNTSGETNVYNVVFAGLVYEEAPFFYKALQRYLNGENTANWDPKPQRATWAIGYPQIDGCTAFEC